MKRIPVILDTDIGGDIDDTWALAMLLNSPELDLRLVTTTTGDTVTRAKIVARILEIAGRTDIPIGIGEKVHDEPLPQGPWVADYDLARFAGRVFDRSPEAIIDVLEASKEPVTVMAIGPMRDLAAVVAARPDLARKSRFVGMCGAIRRGHQMKPHVFPEYNVRHAPAAARAVLEAPWIDRTITPLDTCGWVRLTGEHYSRVARSQSPLARAVIENYRLWLADRVAPGSSPQNADSDTGQSSILYDCVAVYLAFASELTVMETMGLRVTETGLTVPDDACPSVNCAMEWKDLDAFCELVADRVVADPL